MTQAAPARRWAVSFADLALLIACMLLLGWRPSATSDRAGDGVNQTAATERRLALSVLFVPGEATLRPEAMPLLAGLRGGIPDGARIRIAVGSAGEASLRYDAWELAAARTVVIARQLGRVGNVDLAAPLPDSREVVVGW